MSKYHEINKLNYFRLYRDQLIALNPSNSIKTLNELKIQGEYFSYKG